MQQSLFIIKLFNVVGILQVLRTSLFSFLLLVLKLNLPFKKMTSLNLLA